MQGSGGENTTWNRTNTNGNTGGNRNPIGNSLFNITTANFQQTNPNAGGGRNLQAPTETYSRAENGNYLVNRFSLNSGIGNARKKDLMKI
jgi:hypothetical protein